MTQVTYLPFHAFHLALLRGASLLVPTPRRAEWYQEWIGELWHVRRSCCPEREFSWAAERELASFCLGSYSDAVWLMREDWQSSVHSSSVHGSAWQTVLYLSTLVGLCAMIGHLLPGILSEREAVRSQLPADVLLIHEGGSSQLPSIPLAGYRNWNAHRQRYFTALAFYRTGSFYADAKHTTMEKERIAFASQNLFRILGVEIPNDGLENSSGVRLAVLSRAYWRETFHANPRVVGQTLQAGNRKVRVVGIAPTTAARLPGSPDIWILESDRQLLQDGLGAPGFMVARLSPEGQSQMLGANIEITAMDKDGNETQLYGDTFGPQTSGPTAIYLFALFLAILALPAIVSVFGSESDVSSHHLSFATRTKRGIFLAVKIALIAALGYFAGLDLAYWNFADYSPTAEFLQLMSTFAICLFGLRWALKDQSRRCPVCLRCVTHPAQVGIASCNFLGWNGTEMICTGGHALLHVPGLPTSWFSRERWLYLDASWDFLFSDTASGS